MVIAQHHADFGLTVMIMDDHAGLFGKPTDDLWVERLAGAADHTQLTPRRAGELRARRDQQAIGRRRAGQVADRVFFDDPAGGVHRESAVIEQRGVAARQRAGDRVIQAIGPTRVGQVPETVVFAQIDRFTHVALEGQEGAQGHLQRLGRPRGSGGAHQQKRCTGVQQLRCALRRVLIQRTPEVVIARMRRGTVGHDDGRAVADIIQLGAVEGIGHDPACLRTTQALLDGLGSEGGKERLVDRADAPGPQNGDQQFNRTGHQARDTISRLDALLAQKIAETRRVVLQFAEGVARGAAILRFAIQCDGIALGVPVAAFDTGIQGIQLAVQIPGGQL
ncbi:hypothetical protein ALQ17_01888 [Pseudomonas fluorescens]|nr:hypothetical protein ALQ17_01888 [Pseudomonas fluorescens]